MNKLVGMVSILPCVLASFACHDRGTSRDPGVSLIVENVTVVDVVSGTRVVDRCIEIAGDRIHSVAACEPDGIASSGELPVVDGSGRFVIPGLWDMHVHLTDATEIALPALIASGITTVRDMGGDLETLDTWRAEIVAGRRDGPHFFRAGPVLDGSKPGAPYRVTISRPDEARSALATLIDRGTDHVKIHNAVPRDAYFALLDEARSHGAKVVGHVPMTVSPSEAVEAGQAGIEHIATLFEGTVSARYPDPFAALEAMESFAESEAVELSRKMVSHGTSFTPTLVAYESRARRAALATNPDPRTSYVARSLREQWDRFFPVGERDADPRIIAARQRAYRAWVRTVGRMYREGVSVMAGTDLGARDVYPGSLHDELIALVGAGLSTLEALQAATVTPAQFQSGDRSLATVTSGAPADLVLLEADPLDDIRNTRKIVAVIARGRYYDRPALDALLDRVRSEAAAR